MGFFICLLLFKPLGTGYFVELFVSELRARSLFEWKWRWSANGIDLGLVEGSENTRYRSPPDNICKLALLVEHSLRKGYFSAELPLAPRWWPWFHNRLQLPVVRLNCSQASLLVGQVVRDSDSNTLLCLWCSNSVASASVYGAMVLNYNLYINVGLVKPLAGSPLVCQAASVLDQYPQGKERTNILPGRFLLPALDLCLG